MSVDTLGPALEECVLEANWTSSLGDVGPLLSLGGGNNIARPQKLYFSANSEIQRCRCQLSLLILMLQNLQLLLSAGKRHP